MCAVGFRTGEVDSDSPGADTALVRNIHNFLRWYGLLRAYRDRGDRVEALWAGLSRAVVPVRDVYVLVAGPGVHSAIRVFLAI